MRKVYGIAELAEALGKAAGTVAQMNRRETKRRSEDGQPADLPPPDEKLPPPDEQLATGPVWLRATIEHLLSEDPWSTQDLGMWPNRTAMRVLARDPHRYPYQVALAWSLADELDLTTGDDRETFVLERLRDDGVVERMEAERAEQASEVRQTNVAWTLGADGEIEIGPLPD